jgi:hypothetical protein
LAQKRYFVEKVGSKKMPREIYKNTLYGFYYMKNGDYKSAFGRISNSDSSRIFIVLEIRKEDTLFFSVDSLIGIYKPFKTPSLLFDIADYSSLPLIAMAGIIPLVWMEEDFTTALLAGGICVGVATLMALPILLDRPLSKKYNFRKGKWKFFISDN